MSVYSTNQARHLYVATATSDYTVSKDAEGNMFIKIKNADGELIRTDLITNILSAKATKASALARPLNGVGITANSDIAAGSHTLGITYRQWVAASDEVFYHEWASAKLSVAGTAATAAELSAFYVALAINLAKNTEKQGLVEVGLVYTESSADSTVLVTSSTKASTLTKTYKEIVIYEKKQPWVLGTTPQTQVYINKDAVVCDWGTAEDVTPQESGKDVTITNGREIADLEYFCLGERGDQYRNVGWPYVTPTAGRVDPEKQYDIIDIHYSYVGANEGVQKSEKTLTIACLNESGTTYTVANDLISKINSAAGTSMTALS